MLSITISDSVAIGGFVIALILLCILIGRAWGRSDVSKIRFTDDLRTIKILRLNKFLNGQIKGFKKAGGELLSLTIKSLDSIDKDKLRTIRRFRSLLTWADKYIEVSQ